MDVMYQYLLPSSHLHTDYYNCKEWYSILIEGLADANYQLLDVCAGWPGNVHDARVFAHFALYSEIEDYHILPNQTITIYGILIPLYMIGDSVYSLKSWLIKPFPHNTLLTAQPRNYECAELQLLQKLHMVVSRQMVSSLEEK